MTIFKNIMDKLSGGSYSRSQDTDIQKVIAERDELQKELDALATQYNEMFTTAQEVVNAKEELMAALERLAQENMLLRTALGTKAISLREVKN